MPLYKAAGFSPDPWRHINSIEELPAEGYVILRVEDWQRLARPKQRTNMAFGLVLEPAQRVEAIADALPYLGLVAIQFPKFTDGRGYSLARQIRERYKFAGEVRATGDVLFDQLQFMTRCGFDAFEISDPVTIKLLEQERNPNLMRHFYQPGYGSEESVDLSPWKRRPPA